MSATIKRALIHAPATTAHCQDYLYYLEPIFSSWEVIIVKDDFPRRSAYRELLDIAINNNCEIILSLVGEKLISCALFALRLNRRAHAKPKVLIFYFLYHNLFALSLKSILLCLIFRFSPIDRILISDPALPLRSRISHRLIKNSLAYVCDPCSFVEAPSSRNASQFKIDFGIEPGSIVIACPGLLNKKKAIDHLINALISADLDRLRPISFLLAGKLDPDLESIYWDPIQRLHAQGIIIPHFRYLSDSELASLISFSDATWCVQGSFSGSSGIFSKSCFAGTIPITASDTTIGRVSEKYGFGYCIDLNFMLENLYELRNFLCCDNAETRPDMSSRARAYARLNSPKLFTEQVKANL